MRAGFLSGSKARKPLQSIHHVVPTADAAPVQPGVRGSTEPPSLTQEQWNRNFEECLQLLRGPNDESRFVGLLVASKLLHQGGDAALQKVLDAVGWDFLQRMLLPLVRGASRPASMTEEQAQQQQMTTGVGLSVLAAMCRLPEVAASTQLQGLIPGCIRLLEAGSTAQLMQTKPIHAASSSPGYFNEAYAANADWAAMEDAIECLLAACSTQPHEPGSTQLPALGASDNTPADPQPSQASVVTGQAAQQDVVEQGGIQAICRVLGGLLVAAPKHRWQPASMGVANAWRLPVLAVRLLCLLWLSHVHGSSQQDPSVVSLVVVLGHFLGLPEILQSGSAAAAATAARKANAAARAQELQQQQQQQQGPALGTDELAGSETLGTIELEQLAGDSMGSASASGTGLGDAASSTGAGRTADLSTAGSTHAVQIPVVQTVTEDATVLQLQSLHALLLLLPEVLSLDAGSPEASALVDMLALSETMPQQQKQKQKASLGSSMTAAGWGAAARRGLGWLLRGQSLGDDVRHATLQVCAHLARLLGGSWLLDGSDTPTSTAMLAVVLAEVLQVELGLLLRDLMAAGTQAISNTAHPEPSDKLLQELEQRRQQREQQGQQAVQQAVQRGQQAVQSTPLLGDSPNLVPDIITTANTKPNIQYTVGQRALERLPAVLGLLEALIEGLALASQAEAENGMQGVEPASSLQQYTPRVPHVPLQVQEQLMMSVSASVQLVLQFLQSVQEQLDSANATGTTDGHVAATGSVPTSPVKPAPEPLLACTRLLGHYLAEAPDALDEQVQAVLPVLLLAHPGFIQAANARGSQQSLADLQELAVQFLLPGLLQASWGTQPAAGKLRQQFLQAPGCLACIIAALDRAVQQSTQALQQASDDGNGATTQNRAGVQQQQRQAMLLQADKQAADVCMLLLNIMNVTEAPSGSLTSAQTSVIQVLLPVMASLAAWAQVRVVSEPAFYSASVGSAQQVQQLLQALAGRGLMPRTVLCTAAVAAVVLQAYAATGADTVTAIGARLVEADVQLLCSFVAVGVRLGLGLAVAVALEDVQPGSLVSGQHTAQQAQQGGGITMPVSMQDVLEDWQGDAESCWEAIALSTASSLHALPQLRAALQSVQSEGLAATQQAGGDVFAQAQSGVVMQSMGWRMLTSALSQC